MVRTTFKIFLTSRFVNYATGHHAYHTRFFRRFFRENEQSPAIFLSPTLTYKRSLTVHSHITVSTELLTDSSKNFFSQALFIISSTISLASSSKTPSGADQTTSSGLLGIKANQNLILDLDRSK